MGSDQHVLVAVVAIVLATVSLAILVGHDKISSAAKACEAAGGVQVKQYTGFVCIKATKVVP